MVNPKDSRKIASMTAFASLEGGADGLAWSWEMRGVNGRGLDLRLRLPEGLGAVEQPLRAALSKALSRGNVTVSLRLGRSAGAGAARLNPEALAAAVQALAQVEAQMAATGSQPLSPSTAAEVLALRGVMEEAQTHNLPQPAQLMDEAQQVIGAFTAMRAAEGAALAAVMEAQLARMAELTEAAAQAAAARTSAQGHRLRAQVTALLAETDAVDEARLAQELALLAVKADVMEEIDRLSAHISAARDLIAGGGPVGRKLDFLMQEFNREANTLCAKSQDTALTAIGLDLKLTIDQMREQVQNVE